MGSAALGGVDPAEAQLVEVECPARGQLAPGSGLAEVGDWPERDLMAIGRLRSQLGGRVADETEGEVIGAVRAAQGGEGGDGANAEEAIDVKVLEVDYDAQGVSYKPRRPVVAECAIHYLRDWPLDGGRMAFGVMKHMEKFGPRPTQWVETFARWKLPATTDRAYHELMLLAEAFEAFGCHDQCNMPASVGVEILMKRSQTILEAHAVLGAKPNYSMAASYSGVALMEDSVSPGLRTHRARRLKEKYLESQVQRIGRGGGTEAAEISVDYPIAESIITVTAMTAAAAPEGTGAGPPRGGAGRGRGRGRSRRGLSPPSTPQS